MRIQPLQHEEHHLQGLLHLPEESDNAVPNLLFLSAGHRQGPFGLYRQLCERLVSAGFPCLRFHRASDTRRYGLTVDDAIAAIDMTQRRTRHNRFVLAAHQSATELAIETALTDRRVIGLYLIDDPAFRTRSFHFHHWLLFMPRKILSRRFWKLRFSALATTAPDASIAPIDKHSKRYRIWRLIQRGLHVHLAYTGGHPNLYNNGDQWVQMYGDLTPGKLLSSSWLPHSDSDLSRPDQRELLTRNLVSWMQSNFSNADSGTLNKAA